MANSIHTKLAPMKHKVSQKPQLSQAKILEQDLYEVKARFLRTLTMLSM
jgi:hypothetical protein